jgi:4'-phosphopantetheinyl transferase
VQVWQVDLQVDGTALADAASLLSPTELARADQGTSTVRRRRIVLRAALRSVLGAALACHPADVPLGAAASGRPRLEPPAPPWDVNCARSDEVGLIVVARGPRVGIDVERVAPWTGTVAEEGWLSPAEVRALLALPPAERGRAAAHCWTQKEAVLKAIGSGLSLPPAGVRTSPGRRAARSGGWALSPVAVPPGFTASLACSTRVRTRGSAILPRALPDPTSATGHHHDRARHR